MSTLFSLQKLGDDPFRVIAKTAHKVTYLVCECESIELADYLVDTLNESDSNTQKQIISLVQHEIQQHLKQTA